MASRTEVTAYPSHDYPGYVNRINDPVQPAADVEAAQLVGDAIRAYKVANGLEAHDPIFTVTVNGPAALLTALGHVDDDLKSSYEIDTIDTNEDDVFSIDVVLVDPGP